MVTSQTQSYRDQLISAYKARRQRFAEAAANAGQSCEKPQAISLVATGDEFRTDQPTVSPLRHHLKHRAEDFGFTVAEMIDHDRQVCLALSRQIIWYEMRNMLAKRHSHPDIARLFNRDHATIVHGVQKIMEMGYQKAMKKRAEMREDMDRKLARCRRPNFKAIPPLTVEEFDQITILLADNSNAEIARITGFTRGRIRKVRVGSTKRPKT